MFKKLVLLVTFLSIICLNNLFAQNQKLFINKGVRNGSISDAIKVAEKLEINKSYLNQLFQNKAEFIEIEIPFSKEPITLILKKVKLLSNNFEVILSSTLEAYNYEQGYYLQGTIKEYKNSIAAISIFNNHLGGIVSFNGDNYNLTIANNYTDYNTKDYLLYADKNFTLQRPQCYTVDEANSNINLSTPINRSSAAIGCPIDIYFEAANAIYTAQGNNIQNVMNYVTTFFNAVQALYANENLLIQIREVKVWNTVDPENSFTTTSSVLAAFASRMSFGFNGDLAHYITYKGLGGGVAYVDVLCSSDRVKTAVSGNMSANYAAYPNYSFTINVVAHEMGHNFGSRHTQNCIWPGGAIDNCVAPEGTCPSGPAPINGGTIMSYCHTTSVGVNFANGFGPLPGNLIRQKALNASNNFCICDCDEIILDITKSDIGCGSATGTATAIVSSKVNATFTYLWSNGQTTPTITGLTAGIYYVKVTGSSPNCTVIKGVIIKNNGTSIPVTLNPAAANIVKCLGETYTLNASSTASGSLSFQWYKNSSLLLNDTLSSLTISTPGIYNVQIKSSSCTGQSSNVNVSFQNISTPVITVTGDTTFCANDSVKFSIQTTLFLIQWLQNGMVIPGANSTTYYAKTAGVYSVKLFSANSTICSATSLTKTVIINPAPLAITSPSGNTSFCSGSSLNVNHSLIAGNSLQWYKNNLVITGEINNILKIDKSGSYTLKVTSMNGCTTTSLPIDVIVNPLPDSILTPNGSVSICKGGSQLLTIAPTNNVFKQFKLKNITSTHYFCWQRYNFSYWAILQTKCI